MNFIEDTALFPEASMLMHGKGIDKETRDIAMLTFENRPKKDALEDAWKFWESFGVTWKDYSAGAFERTRYYNNVMRGRDAGYNKVKVDLDAEELEEHLREIEALAEREKNPVVSQANSRYTPGSAKSLIEDYSNLKWVGDSLSVEWNLFKAVTGRDGLPAKMGHIFSLHKDVLTQILGQEVSVIDYRAFEPRIAAKKSGTMGHLMGWDQDPYECDGERQVAKDSFISVLYGMQLGKLSPKSQVWAKENLYEYIEWASEFIQGRSLITTDDFSWLYPTIGRSRTQQRNAIVQPESSAIIRRAFSTCIEDSIPLICHQHDSLLAPVGYEDRIKRIMEDLGYPTSVSTLTPK